jgi:hypothetical protein
MNFQRLFLIVLFLINSSCFLCQSGFNYKIQLLGVNDNVTAKMATDHLRDLFKTYPTFNDSLDVFEFISTVRIDPGDFSDYITGKGYTVLYFKRDEPIIVNEVKAEDK